MSEPCRWLERRLSVSEGYLLSPSEWTLGVSRNSLSFHVPTVPSKAWYLISMEMLVCNTQGRHCYHSRASTGRKERQEELLHQLAFSLSLADP